MTTTKSATADVTKEMIEAWKSQFGKVTKYVATDGKTLFFRTPTRKEISASQAVANDEKDGIKSNQVLAKACVLAGDVDVLEQDRYLLGIGKHLQNIIDVVEGEMSEL